ncbi:uncharacterized protein DUF3237 [Agrobacterium vitis]|nr:uncharacterized protein DUF3237 [Agrobacterium vitis]
MSYLIEPKEPPHMVFCGEIRAGVGMRRNIETHGGLSRDFTPVTGGSFNGPRINARILEGGGDWSTAVDGIFRLDARYVMETDRGDVFEIQNRGIGHSNPALFEEIGKTGKATLDTVYFRTTALFFTQAKELSWLGEKIFIGVGREFGPELTMHIFEVL